MTVAHTQQVSTEPQRLARYTMDAAQLIVLVALVTCHTHRQSFLEALNCF